MNSSMTAEPTGSLAERVGGTVGKRGRHPVTLHEGNPADQRGPRQRGTQVGYQGPLL